VKEPLETEVLLIGSYQIMIKRNYCPNLPVVFSPVAEPKIIKDVVGNVSDFQDWCSRRVFMMNKKHCR